MLPILSHVPSRYLGCGAYLGESAVCVVDLRCEIYKGGVAVACDAGARKGRDLLKTPKPNSVSDS